MILPPFPPPPTDSDALGASLSEAGATCRACRDDDLPFLRQLYRQTRDDELAATGWPEQAKAAFASGQFDLQHTHFLCHFPAAHFFVLHRDGRAIGRYYLDAAADAWHVVDIAIVTGMRGRGIGSALLDATRRLAPAITLNVAINNPSAIRLYARLGFVDVGEAGGMHRLMRAS